MIIDMQIQDMQYGSHGSCSFLVQLVKYSGLLFYMSRHVVNI